jgi:hypothetical protein
LVDNFFEFLSLFFGELIVEGDEVLDGIMFVFLVGSEEFFGEL